MSDQPFTKLLFLEMINTFLQAVYRNHTIPTRKFALLGPLVLPSCWRFLGCSIVWFFYFESWALVFVGEDWLDFDFTSADLLFYFFFTLTPPTISCGECGLLFFFSFSLLKYPWGTVGELSFSLPKFSWILGDSLRVRGVVTFVSSECISCSELVGDF